MAAPPTTPAGYAQRFIIIGIWIVFTAVFLAGVGTGLRSRKSVIGLSIMLCLFFLLSVVWMWCYYNTSWGDAGSTEAFYHEIGVLDDIRRGSIPRELQAVPVCNKCNLPKPRRAHHCRHCDRCYFRYDHHCPSTGNCIGLWNVKGFILVQFYGGLLMFFIAVALFLVDWWAVGGIVLFAGCVLFVLPVPFCQTVLADVTTMEAIALKFSGPENASAWHNYRQIFDGCAGMFLPTRPATSGFAWEGAEIAGAVDALVRQRAEAAGGMDQPLLHG
jgi:ribosomal protein L40E